MSYFYDSDGKLTLSERRSMASLDSEWFPNEDFRPAPPDARPVIGLDDLNHVLISMYAVYFDSFTFPDEYGPRQALSNITRSIPHGQRKGPGMAKHIGAGDKQAGLCQLSLPAVICNNSLQVLEARLVSIISKVSNPTTVSLNCLLESGA